ncbi:MAG: SDR family NAD(P)-dependent oxidoreductase [Prochloraceae cyanobacterium]|nr:SDR family NAD(P)-dependent oxidoreductase [Prochloraceae cyanobacterium]
MNWSQTNILIISDALRSPIAQALKEQLLLHGGQVKNVTYEQVFVDDIPAKETYSHFIALLPETPKAERQFLPLAEMIQRLKSISNPPKDTCIAYIQFGKGYFSSGTKSTYPEVSCAAGFARSIHLERPDLRVRVIDLDREIEIDKAAELAIAELSGTEAITTVGYDKNLTRLIPQARLQEPANYKQRSLHWSEQDVILVTGGAKGITAECALALAKKTGVKMALVGRSAASNPEVAQTLGYFQAEGITYGYYSCDITNFDAVTHLVEKVTLELGTITGVVHGAGANKPRRVEQVSVEQAIAEVSPKLLGADNLLKVLAPIPPKLIVAFSSIIGVTGMPGNACYAFANESLDLMLRRFESDYPNTQILSLAYSVWGELGMGVRMKSVKYLERMGIGAIPTSEGVSRFLKLFECDPGVKQVIIAARLGGLDTWSPVSLPSPANFRFIERVLDVEPGVELKVRTHLSLEQDLYVSDHVWRGSYLFPTVFGLEAMAQAVAYMTGEVEPPIIQIEDISLRRPIVVHPKNGVNIEIYAKAMEVDENGKKLVRVGIRTEQTGFKINHFAATFVLGELKVGDKRVVELDRPLDIEPKTDLYGSGLLFQGTRFQRMESIFSLNREKSVFHSSLLSETELSAASFASSLESKLILGDAYFRDVLLQSVQLLIPQNICLPVQIDKIEFFPSLNPEQTSRIVTVVLQKCEGREYISEVVATDEQGYIVERLTGYRLRILEESLENPTAEDLANPEVRDRKQLHKVLNTTFRAFGLNQPAVALGYTPHLQGKSLDRRRYYERPIITQALKTKLNWTSQQEIDFQIKTQTSGKPELSGSDVAGLDLSLSHCKHYCLCVVDRSPQGCDIELVTHRTAEDWNALLSSTHSSIIDELMERGNTRDRAGTRIWSSLEAIRKAFNEIKPQFSIVAHRGDGVLFRTQAAKGYLILTVPIKLTRLPERMIAIIVPESQQEEQRSFVSSTVNSLLSR